MIRYRSKVYTASKIYHASMWRKHREVYSNHIEFTACWINHDGPDHNTTFWSENDKLRHWMQDIQDVQRSDFLIAFTGLNDNLAGTLVEVGAAIGLGKVVLAVGFSGTHSWQHHPLVYEYMTVQDALDFIAGGIK